MISTLRIALSGLAVMSALGSIAQAEPSTQENAGRPNILFIFADDWGWGDLSCHGSKVYKTPNLDKLAATGTDFHRFTVASGVCSPSRTAVMTGHYPARYCIHQHFASVEHHIKCGMPDWLPPDAPSLPRLLKEAGYATAHFGKWHLTNGHVPDAPVPTAYGYDESAVFNGPGPQVNANPTKEAPTATHKAIDFIRRHREQPFFINLWVHATHTPHYPTERWLKQFEHLEKRQQVYAAVVAETDERIGQVLAVLDELELAENTLVIFSSDNGPENSGPRKRQDDAATGRGLGTFYSVGTTGGLRGRKRSLFHGGVGVPFLVRWLVVVSTGKKDVSTFTIAVDLLPTFCEIAGADLPENYQSDGQNILPALRGKEFNRRRPIFWQWHGARHGENWPRLGAQDGPWTLLMNEDGSRAELYNTLDDRGQAKNVFDKHPQIAKRLTGQVFAWKKTLPNSPPEGCFSKLRKQP